MVTLMTRTSQMKVPRAEPLASTTNLQEDRFAYPGHMAVIGR
jgi:hypothetical protein